MIRSVVVATPELGDRSYLIHDGQVGLVIDPQRDFDRYIDAATEAGVRIVCVAETHVHNDYLSGGKALSDFLRVPYLVAAGELVSFDRRAVHHGDEIHLSAYLSVQVAATPGHTPHHVSYVILERGAPVMVCSGGSLLYGTAGRTDLHGAHLTHFLAEAQYQSVKTLCDLADDVEVLPTHGFGSFCAAAGGAPVERSTIGEERRRNLVFAVAGPAEFASELIDRFRPCPAYYARMGPANLVGAAAPDLGRPYALRLSGLLRWRAAGAWLLDLRARRAFAARHLAGTVNAEPGPAFSTYVGWVLPPGTPVALMGESDDVVRRARRDLCRVGVDDIVGAWTPGPDGAWVGDASYRVAAAADLAAARRQPGTVVLDVRNTDEWDDWHLGGALHLPLGELLDRMEEIPAGPVWVHCAAGYRAALAASLLEGAGRDVVLVDGSVAAIAGRAA